MKLSLFAVGDDDQNIYAFAGASIRYIRQFEHIIEQNQNILSRITAHAAYNKHRTV